MEPYPDSLLEDVPDAAPGPEARYERKEAIGLAFVTGLQRLTPRQRELVEDFAGAVESGDVDRVVALLSDGAWLTMPPQPERYQGHAAIAKFLTERARMRGVPLRVVPTGANGQPAIGCYFPAPDAPTADPWGLLVLTLEDDEISAITWFADTDLLRHFSLPGHLPV
jgi:RNA polymerase sigma-70 factor, ECF subfamily